MRDKFAREMKLCQESRWRYFKQMQFLVDSIRQYRESLLGKCANGSQNAGQVADPTQQQQAQQQTVVDIFAQPFNGSATTSAQALTHPHGELGSERKILKEITQTRLYYYRNNRYRRCATGHSSG